MWNITFAFLLHWSPKLWWPCIQSSFMGASLGWNFILIKPKIYHRHFKKTKIVWRWIGFWRPTCTLEVGGYWMNRRCRDLIKFMFSLTFEIFKVVTVCCIISSILCTFTCTFKIPLGLHVMKQHRNDFFDPMQTCV